MSRNSEAMFHKANSAATHSTKRSLKSSKVKGKRAPRYSSNIFAMFEESQIQEFKEAFNMIDQNRDGVIDKEDLQDMLASLGQGSCVHVWPWDVDTETLTCEDGRSCIVNTQTIITGKNPTDHYLDEMLNCAPGPINFTMFLTMFGQKLQGTDPEDVIKNAFACFDESGSGYIQEDRLRELLTTMGDRLTQDEVDEIMRDSPSTGRGFDYVAFSRMLKHGKPSHT